MTSSVNFVDSFPEGEAEKNDDRLLSPSGRVASDSEPREDKRGGQMRYTFNNPELTPNARNLRKNMTKQERELWYRFLNTLELRFRRQKVIGQYIVDFYCAEKKLAIELDGSQHFETKNIEKDAERTKFLNDKGIVVLRYTNLQVDKNFKNVCEDIYAHLS